MIKRFLIYGLSNQWGGVESIIHSIIHELEEESCFDILISGKEIDKRHLNHGKNVHVLPITSWGESPSTFATELKQILLISEYHFVWINASLMCNRSVIATVHKNSTAKIITHAHGSFFEEPNLMKKMLLLGMHYYNRRFFHRIVDYKCACSENAAKWFYGKKSFDDNNVYVIKNGIKTLDFIFNDNVRQKYRDSLGITDEIVLFHAGRLTPVKNQTYIIDIVKAAIDKGLNVKLFIAGDGELKQKLHDKVHNLGLDNRIYFLGNRNDINCLYQTSDIFLLPSHHEGFPVTLTEAQTSGLPCLVSSNISKETNISGGIRYLPISQQSIPLWVDAIKEVVVHNNSRYDHGQYVIAKHYDIKDVAKDFKSYIGM